MVMVHGGLDVGGTSGPSVEEGKKEASHVGVNHDKDQEMSRKRKKLKSGLQICRWIFTSVSCG